MATVTKFASTNTVVTTGWTNPTNAYADDGSYATAAPAKSASVVTDYGFAAFTTSDIPSGSTINSVTIEVQYKSDVTTSTGATIGVRLNDNGTLHTETTFGMATTDQTVTRANSSAVTLANLAAALVKARVSGSRLTSNTAVTWSVDYVKLTVSYTPVQSASANNSASATQTATALGVFLAAASDSANATQSAAAQAILYVSSSDAASATHSATAGLLMTAGASGSAVSSESAAASVAKPIAANNSAVSSNSAAAIMVAAAQAVSTSSATHSAGAIAVLLASATSTGSATQSATALDIELTSGGGTATSSSSATILRTTFAGAAGTSQSSESVVATAILRVQGSSTAISSQSASVADTVTGSGSGSGTSSQSGSADVIGGVQAVQSSGPAPNTPSPKRRRRHVVVVADEETEPELTYRIAWPHFAQADGSAHATHTAEVIVIRPKRLFVKFPVLVTAAAKSAAAGHGAASVIRGAGAVAQARAAEKSVATTYRPHSLASEKATASVIRFAEGRGKGYSDERVRGKHIVEFSADELELLTAVASELFFK